MNFKFDYRVQVRECHLDSFGHVNNAMYLVLFEEARWEFITAAGYGLERIQQDQLGPVLIEASVRFKRELKNREWIHIQSRPGEFNGKLVEIHQQMVRGDGKVAAEARFLVGFMDLKERKLVIPSDAWLRACGVDR